MSAQVGVVVILSSVISIGYDSEYSESEIIHKRSPDGTICTVYNECYIEHSLADWENVEDTLA